MIAHINRLIELQRLLGSFSQVNRMIYRKHGKKFRPENDTEHSYDLAITAWYLAKWFPKLNKDLLIRYALAHDLIEIYAGDTFIYGSKSGIDSKNKREKEALAKLETEWSDFDDLSTTIHAFESKKDAESKFIYALDKIMPIMLNYVNDGYSWKKESINIDMLHQAKLEKVKLSPEILPYYEELYKLLLSRPDLIKLAKH